jgi:hypothetical protein
MPFTLNDIFVLAVVVALIVTKVLRDSMVTADFTCI